MNKVVSFFPQEFSLWRSCPWCWSGSDLWPTTARSCSCFQLSESKTLSNSHLHNSHQKRSEVEEDRTSHNLCCAATVKTRDGLFPAPSSLSRRPWSKASLSELWFFHLRAASPVVKLSLIDLGGCRFFFIQFWALLSAAAPSVTRPQITGNSEKFQGVLRIVIQGKGE